MALYKWITGGTTPISGVIYNYITVRITGRGPPCQLKKKGGGDLHIKSPQWCRLNMLKHPKKRDIHQNILVGKSTIYKSFWGYIVGERRQ